VFVFESTVAEKIS